VPAGIPRLAHHCVDGLATVKVLPASLDEIQAPPSQSRLCLGSERQASIPWHPGHALTHLGQLKCLEPRPPLIGMSEKCRQAFRLN
jgi:hypothetical protein